MSTVHDHPRDAPSGFAVTWFPPHRPTDGNTVFLRPERAVGVEAGECPGTLEG